MFGGIGSKTSFALYLRNFIFGVEDSLVSTVGFLSGIAIAGVQREAIFVTGIVLVAVEAFSMAVGSFLSEHSAEDYIKQAEVPLRHALAGGAVMFFSYLLSGFIPLLPYLAFEVEQAFWLSIALSALALFLLGIIGAKFANVNMVRSGLTMMIIGGTAIVVGIAVGKYAKWIL